MNDPLVLDAFYVVWREDGPGPAVKHSTLTKAQREAERLARANPGSRFVVLESQCAFEVNNLNRIAYATEIPF